MNTDITERKEAEQSQLLLMAEVNHRAKNLLSVVQAVARQTAGEENPKLYAERLSERISSLAASHDLLVANRWRGVAVGELAASQLAHFKDLIGSRITLQGADVLLKPAASQALGMALHELATNAAKYGALRDGEGRVGISWAVSGRGDDARFSFEWKEHMGAPPGPPARKGFGHRVLSDMVRHALDANVCLEYPDTGFVWRFDAPADRALEPEDNAPIQSEQEPGKIASSNC